MNISIPKQLSEYIEYKDDTIILKKEIPNELKKTLKNSKMILK